MRIDNPHKDKSYDKIYKDQNGDEEYGERTVQGLTELVHIPSGQSNMMYHQPEMVLRGDCHHQFKLIDQPKREIECINCGLTTSFHPVLGYEMSQGRHFVRLHGVNYELIL